jgi:hypothetical protein
MPIRTTKTTITALSLALVLLAVGCGSRPQFKDAIGNFDTAAALRRECSTYVRTFEESLGKEASWDELTTRFPDTIASIHPRGICVYRDRAGVAVTEITAWPKPDDCRVLVVLQLPVPVGFKPRQKDWEVWKLADGIWEAHRRVGGS